MNEPQQLKLICETLACLAAFQSMALSHPEDAFLVVIRDLKRSRRLKVLEKARYKMNFSILMKLRKELKVFNVSSFTKPFFYCNMLGQ